MLPPIDAALAARLDALAAEGWTLWETFDREVRSERFHPFVAADYDAVRAALVALRAPGCRFLEWGSATGVITIMADLLGYEAIGIELDETLVRTARALATRMASAARFVTGSFVPSGYRYRSRHDPVRVVSIGEGASAYPMLGRALDEFDVVFGFPWPGEEPLLRDLMTQYGAADATLVLYGVHDGIRAYRGGREVRLAL